MPGTRRLPRSPRVTAAIGLLLLSAGGVAAALAASAALPLAAVTAVLCGAASARLLHAEVVRTRHDAAVGRAEQSRAFGRALTAARKEHARFTSTMVERLADRDSAIRQLAATALAAEHRAGRAEQAAHREARRADAAQERLTTLLGDVLDSQAAALSAVGVPDVGEMPALTDLLAWEDRADAAVLDDLRSSS